MKLTFLCVTVTFFSSNSCFIYLFFFFSISDDVCMIMKFLSNSPICHMTANTFPQLPNPSVVTLTANQHFAVNRWNTNYSGMDKNNK